MGANDPDDRPADERRDEILKRLLKTPPEPKAASGSRLASLGEHRGKNRPRLLNEDQLLRLSEAVEGSIFDTAGGLGFDRLKSFVEVASSISPKFFSQFVESLRK